jgi:hypothetical protein
VLSSPQNRELGLAGPDGLVRIWSRLALEMPAIRIWRASSRSRIAPIEPHGMLGSISGASRPNGVDAEVGRRCLSCLSHCFFFFSAADLPATQYAVDRPLDSR